MSLKVWENTLWSHLSMAFFWRVLVLFQHPCLWFIIFWVFSFFIISLLLIICQFHLDYWICLHLNAHSSLLLSSEFLQCIEIFPLSPFILFIWISSLSLSELGKTFLYYVYFYFFKEQAFGFIDLSSSLFDSYFIVQ